MCHVQALLEATAKGSYGARMPRQQQSTLGPASMARPGGHLPPDARARGHMLSSQHVRPILTGSFTVSSGSIKAVLTQVSPFMLYYSLCSDDPAYYHLPLHGTGMFELELQGASWAPDSQTW